MIITKTPFRISFAGGGSDIRSYYSKKPGKVITSTIDKYIYVIVKKQLGIVEYKFRVNWSKTEFKNSVDKIKHPIVRESLKYFKINFPIEITTFADIPAETGLASSSAFAVGLVHALFKIQGKNPTKYQIANIAAKIEVDILKRNIGKQDHFACSFGGFNKFIFYKNEKVKVTNLILPKKKIKKLNNNLQLFYTSIKRDASKVLSKQVKPSQDQLLKISKLKNFVEPIYKIFMQADKNIDLFGEILNESWEIKKSLSSVISNSILDEYYKTAINAGALGGKILGAGNGGFFLFFIKKNNQKKLEKKLDKLKKLDFNFDFSGSQIMYEK